MSEREAKVYKNLSNKNKAFFSRNSNLTSENYDNSQKTLSRFFW